MAYSANFKQWDHVGNVTPNVERSEPHRPYGDFKPAHWLPVQRYDKYVEEYFVVSAGKAVALDRQGNVVPAGLKVAFAVTSGDVLTYTATDVSEGVIDLTTGVAVAAAAGYTRAEVTAALLERGLLDDDENAEDFISFPIGVAPYNYFKWAGGDGSNPADFDKHNFNLQHQVAVLCKYVIELPRIPASATQLDLSSVNAIEDSAIDDWDEASGRWKSSTGLGLTQRYSADISAGDNVVALVLPNVTVAHDTTNTPWTFSNSTYFANEVSSISGILTTGDYMIDHDVGVILMYEEDGNAAPLSAGTVDYYHYDSVPSSVDTFAAVVGEVRPGDFLKVDSDSNFVKATVFSASDVTVSSTGDPSDAELATIMNQVRNAQSEIIGQLLDEDVHPLDYLGHVRTAYTQLGTMDKMPGSATAGLPSALTYSGGGARMVRIMLLR